MHHIAEALVDGPKLGIAGLLGRLVYEVEDL
jgi:hypothetical protein